MDQRLSWLRVVWHESRRQKFFFFPSFTAQGSLTHGDFIEEKEIVQRHPSLTKKELSVELDLPKSYLSRPWLLLYLYEINETFLHQLLDHFAIIQIGASPTTIEDAWLVKRRCSQAIFDRLLLVADALFIRGEDSLSRAVLAGKPFCGKPIGKKKSITMLRYTR